MLNCSYPHSEILPGTEKNIGALQPFRPFLTVWNPISSETQATWKASPKSFILAAHTIVIFQMETCSIDRYFKYGAEMKRC